MTRVDVFEDIFLVFLALGTLVGIIVVSYTLYNAYKYRDTEDRTDDKDLPALGELPTGGGSGKKLFVSFILSAIVVIALIVWTYGMLLYVEDGPDELDEDAIEVDVQGSAFSWSYEYDNGLEPNELVVPADEPVQISVTSTDVWHTFGITQERVKADAIPGEHDETWFIAEDPGEYENAIECFELCGQSHTSMDDDFVVLEDQEAYEEWVDEQFTLDITLEDEDEEPVTEGVDELTLVHQEEEDHEYAYDGDEFENGSITINEIDQGGDYDVEITPEGDEFEPVEESIVFTGPSDETFTLESPEDEEDDEENNEDEGNDETDNDEEGGEN
ncbi:cytochrome c oxidase subunit II [Halostagnicola bangensis]